MAFASSLGSGPLLRCGAMRSIDTTYGVRAPQNPENSRTSFVMKSKELSR